MPNTVTEAEAEISTEEKPFTPCTGACPLDLCLKFLSGAWTHKIICNLRIGPRRFGELRRTLGTVSSKVLTERLREMEAHGVITRTVLPTSPVTVEYALTPLGHDFIPLFDGMRRVAPLLENAAKSPVPALTPDESPDRDRSAE
ncbi:MAG: helix-turn-helix transcriptional regulator [Oligoflexia bacterium]|nr:helix-turn-helix transcriptional regulator [Oligoflexia bacterium]